MLYLILGILFIFQQSEEIDRPVDKQQDAYKFHSVSGGDLFESLSTFEIQDNEQENTFDSNDTSVTNTDIVAYCYSVRNIRRLRNNFNTKLKTSPLLLDIPPPTC